MENAVIEDDLLFDSTVDVVWEIQLSYLLGKMIIQLHQLFCDMNSLC